MDNQHSNKKRPLGREARSGRSFFRTRHEHALREQELREEESAPRAARSPYGGSRGEKISKPARPEAGERGARTYKTRREEDRQRRDATEGLREDQRRGRTQRRGDRFDERTTSGKRDGKSRREQSAPVMPEEMRLNRYIAMSGVCSRREADQLIEAGEVTVNGVRVDALGTKIRPAQDEVRLNGELLKGEKKVYIVLNKPKGYVTTLDDPHADRTVIDLLKGEVPERVYPVGRLDKNTMGVLLLTNDGNLTRELTHPSFAKKKIYHVFLDKPCSEKDLERLTEGIELEDGPIHADEVSYVEGKRKEVGVELHSGRNRIVRRMFEALGYEVVKLDRVYFAGLTKMGLRRGFWRYLTPREVSALKTGAYE